MIATSIFTFAQEWTRSDISGKTMSSFNLPQISQVSVGSLALQKIRVQSITF